MSSYRCVFLMGVEQALEYRVSFFREDAAARHGQHDADGAEQFIHVGQPEAQQPYTVKDGEIQPSRGRYCCIPSWQRSCPSW